MAAAEPVTRCKGCSECPYHEDNEVKFVCTQCGAVLVCQSCITEFHMGHSLTDLTDVFPRRIKTIKKFIKVCERTYIPKLQDEIKNIHEKLHENSTAILKIVSDIKKQGESLKAQIDGVTETMVTKCKELYKENRANMASYKTEIVTLHDNIKSKVQECHEVLQAGNKVLVYDFEQNLLRPDKAEIPSAPILFLADFTPGISFSDQDLEAIFGAITIRDEMCREATFEQQSSEEKEIVTCEDLHVNFPFENKPSTTRSPQHNKQSPTGQESGEEEEIKIPQVGDVLHEFQHPHTIESLSCKQFKNICAVLENGSNKVEFVSSDGHVIQTVTSKTVIKDICISPMTSRLWICTNDSVIEKAPTNIPALKLWPGNDLCSICVTNSDHIIVGSPLKLIVYNIEGRKRLKSKPGLIAFPAKLTSCSKTNRVAVVDTDTVDFGGKDEPHVKVLSPAFELLFQFTGEMMMEQRETTDEQAINHCNIDPRDVCFDAVGNLLVAEANECSIHILSKNGSFVKTFHSDEHQPLAMHLHMNKNLWVAFGENSRTVKIIKYQD